MMPCLPQHDPRQEERFKQLTEARGELPYAWDRPAGVAMAGALPRRLGYPAGVVAQVTAAGALLAANRAAVKLASGPGGAEGPSSVAWCGRAFAAVPAPALGARALGAEGDRLFAWQRLAGANPFSLACVDRLPDHFPVRDAHLAASLPGDSLEAAAAERRLFLADWRRLDGVRGGRRASGAPKFVSAPMALLVRAAGSSELLPVAIQCGQRPGPSAPIFTPRDGVAWQMARLAAQVADASEQESFFHLGRAHFLIEAFALATERQLAGRHPLHVLLAPHLEGTLAINDGARSELVIPGGQLDQLMAPELDGSLGLVRAALASFRLDEALPPRELARRGVDAAEALPVYPFRDDALPLWHAIHDFVRDYVDLFYTSEADVAADVELRSFVFELRSADGGRLVGLPVAIETRAALVDLIAFVIYTASVLHAALNYTQYDFMGYAPNMPTAAGAAAPSGPMVDADAAWSSALPGRAEVLAQLEFMSRQSQVRINRLGHYGPGDLGEPRAAVPLARFQARLAEIDALIASREPGRLLPYPYLAPRHLTASIHI